MTSDPFNPYAPPAATGPTDRRSPHWWRWGEVAVRALLIVLGFSLVADPLVLPGVETSLIQALGGHILARGIGLGLLAAGFLPWPACTRAASRNATGNEAGFEPEEL